MQILFYQSIFISIVGAVIVISRWIGNKKVYLQVRTMLWVLFFVACLVPVILIKTPFGLYERETGNDSTKIAEALNEIEATNNGLAANLPDTTTIDTAGHNVEARNSFSKSQIWIKICSIIYFTGLVGTAGVLLFQYVRCAKALKADKTEQKKLDYKFATEYLTKRQIPYVITKTIGPCALVL